MSGKKKKLKIKRFFYILLRHVPELSSTHVLCILKKHVKFMEFPFHFFSFPPNLLGYFIYYFILSDESENPMSGSVNCIDYIVSVALCISLIKDQTIITSNHILPQCNIDSVISRIKHLCIDASYVF